MNNMNLIIGIIIAILILFFISSVFVMLIITMPIAKKQFENTFVRTSKEKWGRANSCPENKEHSVMFDAGIAAQTFCLAANEAGFGTVILRISDDAKVAEIIGLPDHMTGAALIPVGEPKFAPDPTPRKETGELVSYI